MRVSALILLLLTTTALDCRRVPSWMHYYSKAQVAETAASIGMTRVQIARLLKCL